MHDHGRSSPARFLAPLALVVFALAVVLVILASSGGGDGGGGGDTARTGGSGTGTGTSSTQTTPRPTRATYIVKTGDTLGSISVKTGVSVERLQTLNPELDPQALLSGQKIKLRE
jgi:LysM repeat protein